jgi:hypothetical protein
MNPKRTSAGASSTRTLPRRYKSPSGWGLWYTEGVTPESVIAAFAKVARPIMLPWMPRNSCVGATRLAQMTLMQHGIDVVPVPCKFVFEVGAKKYAYVSGFRGAEKRRMRREAANWPDRGGRPGESTWTGHLIGVAAGRYLIDCSVDQAASIAHGVEVESTVLVMDLGDVGREFMDFAGEVRLYAMLDSGDQARIVYQPFRDSTYAQSDAWNDEGLWILAYQVPEAMAARAKGGATVAQA